MSKFVNKMSVLILAGMLGGVPAMAQVTKNNLDQNADQSQGNYASTNLNYLGSGALGMMQNAWKDPLQHMGEGQTRPGYTKYYWTPELVLPVRVREGMYTLINFPSWEVIENVYLGDGQSFNAEIQGPSSLMVYPEASQFVGVDTNMIVFGRSGNKYVFYVQSETVNTDRITNAIIDIEVLKSRKNIGAGGTGIIGGGRVSAADGGTAGTSADATYTRDLQKEDWIEKIPVDPTKFRFDIEVYVPNPDDIVIAPERVWRDNIFTYIDLGEKALTAVQRPIVTLIVERTETPVGFRAAGPNNRLIIVEGMGDMVLRSGKRMVCLKLRRADSDGLENTVYAKTNEWDLQNAHASAPTDENNNNGQYEDVYGASSGNTSPQSSENMQSPNAGVRNNVDFFSDNLFSSPNISTPQNNMPAIDSLPKVTPVVAPQTNAATSSQQPEITGQYDLKAGSSELITPDYNNKPVDASITYQKDETSKTVENVAQKAAQMGNSSNNSSPVLISPKENAAEQTSMVSAQTEALLKEFRQAQALNNEANGNISIELGTDENVNNLEKLWNNISKRYSAVLSKYEPFYSVDAPADGQGKDVFHLRVGPVKSLEEGDDVCSRLGRNGIFCSVVRIQ
ncbi:MAG: TrbG/VirB9 family P-type conjugative transfer protein [Alphaproteobacteria bacterium]|nr:TrbG/VirB9 family P-type conjugative transfer protein [Alphaproteobacteria bacterium]